MYLSPMRDHALLSSQRAHHHAGTYYIFRTIAEAPNVLWITNSSGDLASHTVDAGSTPSPQPSALLTCTARGGPVIARTWGQLRLIPFLTDQNLCAQLRSPMDMMRQG